MSEAGLHPLERLLRLCADAAPEPWYPRQFAKQESVDPQRLSRCLEELWLSGLIEKSPGNDETGPAIRLTRAGERVLLDPVALERLRRGKPLTVDDRGAILRGALRGLLRPYLTRLLVLCNVLIFAAGYYYANKAGLGNAFLEGSSAARPVLEKSGAVEPMHLIAGQWWRLLSAGFVHIGFLHLLMNMACLYFIGRNVEQMWGHLRYLVIYLIALLGGCVLAMAHLVKGGEHMILAGASGAVCGVLAAEAVWFFLNRHYLPRALVLQERTNVIINCVLLVFISMFANVSGWGHFGGAAAGAIAAFLLQLHRFGPPYWRWLALVGFVPVIWYGQHTLQQAFVANETWQAVQDHYVEDYVRPTILRAMKEARSEFATKVKPVLEIHPTRRDADKVQTALATVQEQQQKLSVLLEQLIHAGPFGSPEAEKARQFGQDYVSSMLNLLDLADRVLRLGDQRSDKDRQDVQAQEEWVEEMRAKWRDLFE